MNTYFFKHEQHCHLEGGHGDEVGPLALANLQFPCNKS